MKYALVKNGIVDNIIEYDEESLLPDIQRYEKEKKQFDKDKTNYNKLMKAAIDEERSLLADLASLKIMARQTGEKDEIAEKLVKQKLNALVVPKPPKEPRPCKGKFTPAEDYAMILIETSNCDIGWQHDGENFINPQGEDDANK